MFIILFVARIETPSPLSRSSPSRKVSQIHLLWTQYLISDLNLKADKQHEGTEQFRRFRRQLHHTSFAKIYETTKPGMSKPIVRRCPDKHYRRTITDFASEICDYPDQVLTTSVVQGWCPKWVYFLSYCYACSDIELIRSPSRCFSDHGDLDQVSLLRRVQLVEAYVKAHSLKKLWDEYGILGDIVVRRHRDEFTIIYLNLPQPFTNDFPRADIYRMITPDLLHQVIKGAFKDHLVTWVCVYLEMTHGVARSQKVLDEMDRRYVDMK